MEKLAFKETVVNVLARLFWQSTEETSSNGEFLSFPANSDLQDRHTFIGCERGIGGVLLCCVGPLRRLCVTSGKQTGPLTQRSPCVSRAAAAAAAAHQLHAVQRASLLFVQEEQSQSGGMRMK